MRGYFGIGVYHPKTEENIGTLWRSANLFGAQFIFTIGKRYEHQVSDTMKSYKSIPLFNYQTLQEMIDKLPYTAQLVCVEMIKDVTPLQEFEHPEQAVYLLGAEDHGLPLDLLAKYDTIAIPTTKPMSLNVATSGAIVMYDRHIKSL